MNRIYQQFLEHGTLLGINSNNSVIYEINDYGSYTTLSSDNIVLEKVTRKFRTNIFKLFVEYCKEHSLIISTFIDITMYSKDNEVLHYNTICNNVKNTKKYKFKISDYIKCKHKMCKLCYDGGYVIMV